MFLELHLLLQVRTTKKIAKKSEKRVDNEDRGVIY